MVTALLTRVRPAPLLLALCAFCADFLLRSWRFTLMLRAASGRHLAIGPGIAPFIASFGASDLLPLRVGDGLRIYWFSRRFALPVALLVGVMLVERLFDLGAILALAGLALFIAGVSGPSELLTGFSTLLMGVLGITLILLCLFPVIRRWQRGQRGGYLARWIEKGLDASRATLAAARQFGSFRRLAGFGLLSLACWLLESLVLIGAWLSLGGAFDRMEIPLLAFALGTLGTLVPSLPGHFGAFEYFGAQGFALMRADASFGLAVLLLGHLILWAPTALFALVWMTGRSVSSAFVQPFRKAA